MNNRPLKTAHLLRWLARTLPATYPEYASAGPAPTALHLDRFEWPPALFVGRFIGIATLTVALAILGSAVAPDAGEYRRALPGYVFSFPRDHYAHDDFRTEWWYYTGHLRAKTGEEYGYQVTFFRSGLGAAHTQASHWAANNLYFGHFAVSDIGHSRLQFFERASRGALGQAGAEEKTLRVWIGDWEMTGSETPRRLRAREGEWAVDLTLASQKPPAIHGEDGVSQKGRGRGQASHYYSLTRLATEGTLTVGGRSLTVTGQSWMDHEFGSAQLDADQVGWDWFSLQFDSGTELMLYAIRLADGRPDPHSAGTWIEVDDRTIHLKQGDFTIEVLDRWTSPRTKATYPARWRLRVPSLGLDVTVSPAFPDQELNTAKSTQVIYWEGAATASGVLLGRPTKAKGYVELTGYAAPFRTKL